jgi:hypothetical protein
MQETIFGGLRVSSDGIKPDVTKLKVVAKWPNPSNLLDLMKFLGLTGYFRSLIQDYSRIAAPLTDLQHNLDLLKPEQHKGKQKYCQFLRNCNLTPYWTTKHTKVFVRLKRILLEEPILRAPKFDGTPFILTTDTSKDRFGAVLAQRFTTKLLDGEIRNTIHLLGFASKQTIPAEEQYKPYVLEFATLKFGLDHFSDTIWGFPVEIETDCQVMKDTLSNDILNLHHAR